MTAYRLPPTAYRSKGFTLVEMVVVIAIITILATLAVSAIFRVKYNSRINAAKASAIRLCQALEAYQAQMGRLPGYPGNVYVSDLITHEPGVTPYDNWQIVEQLNGIRHRDPFLRIKLSETSPNGGFKDPWGHPYRVWMWPGKRSDGSDEPLDRFFQVYSDGPNMKWERGWPVGAESLPPDITTPDDIAPKH